MSHNRKASVKEALVQARRKRLFMREWITTPTAYPAYAVLIAGVVAVAAIAVHHFSNNNSARKRHSAVRSSSLKFNVAYETNRCIIREGRCNCTWQAKSGHVRSNLAAAIIR